MNWNLTLLCLLGWGITSLNAQVSWTAALKQPSAWYAETEARTIASNVLLYQHSSGGWPKNLDLSRPPADVQRAERSFHEPTIDNGGTTLPLQFLASVATATSDPELKAAVARGLDYLLAAQSPSGGWPQFFPLKAGYYSHITYNDGAMVNVLNVLRVVSDGRPPYQWIDDNRRSLAAAAVARGITCILRTQVKQDGVLTVWCAQHDQTTLQPAWARAFEPPSLSGCESVGLIRFLMDTPAMSPEIIAAVEGAVAWLRAHSIQRQRVDTFTAPDGGRERLVKADPAATPLWARFYELGTNRPIFLGRDHKVHYDFNEIERERRTGYNYLGDWPADLLDKHYPRWKAKLATP